MTTKTRNINTLVDALTELNELLQGQPDTVSGLLIELLGQANAQKLITNTYEVLQWLSVRLQEMTDAAEALDSVAALAEIVIEFFRFLGEGIQAMASAYGPEADLPRLNRTNRSVSVRKHGPRHFGSAGMATRSGYYCNFTTTYRQLGNTAGRRSVPCNEKYGIFFINNINI